MAQNHHDSAGDIRSHLQSLLDAKEQQLQQAAALGQQLLAQQMELEVRIMQLVQELDVDKPDKQAMDKYRELADSLVAWDAENAQFASSAFGETSSPTPSTQVAQHPSEEPTEASANMSAASQSRRAKNAARRADDVEFAFEIGSGLLNEVRRLQALLAERDKEKVDLEASIESLHTTLKQQEQSADKLNAELQVLHSIVRSTNSRPDSGMLTTGIGYDGDRSQTAQGDYGAFAFASNFELNEGRFISARVVNQNTIFNENSGRNAKRMSGIHSAVLTFGLSGTSYQLGRKSKDLELLKSIGEHTGSLRVRNSQLPHEAVALAFVAHLVLFQHALVSPTHIAPAGRIARARAFKRFFFFAGLLNALILVQYVDLVSPGQLVTGS